MYHFQTGMQYIDFSLQNPRCIHCYISDRAYASVITEVLANGQNETGGVFLGYIVNRAWYIVESVDPGMHTVNQTAFFEWDSDYVNYQADRLSRIYRIPLTVLGFWHRHPGSMDYFSGTDEKTIAGNLRELRAGLLSMLVNIDPKLRMTFYYCYGNEIMPIRYDVGNRYFPVELLQYADAGELSRREEKKGRKLEIYYEQVIDLDRIAKKKRQAAAAQPPAAVGQQEIAGQSAVWSRQTGAADAASGKAADRETAFQQQAEQLARQLAAAQQQMEQLSARLALVLEHFSPEPEEKGQPGAEPQSETAGLPRESSQPARQRQTDETPAAAEQPAGKE